jgi:hypothetical protein
MPWSGLLGGVPLWYVLGYGKNTLDHSCGIHAASFALAVVQEVKVHDAILCVFQPDAFSGYGFDVLHVALCAGQKVHVFRGEHGE